MPLVVACEADPDIGTRRRTMHPAIHLWGVAINEADGELDTVVSNYNTRFSAVT